MFRLSQTTVLLALVSLTASGAEKVRPVTPAKLIKTVSRAEETLPNVLLMGDSIANGYSRRVAARLKGVANVDLYVTGKHVVSNLWEDVTPVVAHRSYQVIHFNESTLHAWPPGRVEEGQYEPAFRKYVEAIRANAPEAKLIWASATPMTVQAKPTEIDSQFNPKIQRWNQIGLKVAKEAGIAVNDLYALMLDHLDLGAGDRFHWKGAGAELQAGTVADSIRRALKE
ncbi:MAG: SGNH/GDSL hydrolase family protein [Planctomycetes bacterium]|nr:SGNH/GDSL hydrolase family protein [Planctomycetota bacterium]MBL7042983.1 SGNH/GDSL hydrolase family protein [Pirellulaceae bacterium]